MFKLSEVEAVLWSRIDKQTYST